MFSVLVSMVLLVNISGIPAILDIRCLQCIVSIRGNLGILNAHVFVIDILSILGIVVTLGFLDTILVFGISRS